MKIYHKFLLYQNKLLKPYVRILLGLIEALTYLASLSLIVGVVYEHGFPLSIDEVANLQTLYKTVWIIFLIDVTLHISLEYRNTKKQYRRLAWILSGLLYLTLVPVIIVSSFFPQSVQWAGASVRTAYQSVFDIGSQFYGYYSDWSRLVDASALHGKWYHLGRLFIYRYQCRMRYRLGTGRCVYYIHHFGISCHYPADSDWRIGSDDINQFLRHVLYGEYFHL